MRLDRLIAKIGPMSCVGLIAVALHVFSSEKPAAIDQPRVELVKEERLIDLVDLVPVAEYGSHVKVIEMGESFLLDFLPSGWNIRTPKEGYRWSKSRNAVVDVALVRPGPLTVLMEVASPIPTAPGPNKDGYPPQSIDIHWNGGFVTSVPFPEQRGWIDVNVPIEHQRVGPNRLEIWPHYWLTPQAMGFDPRDYTHFKDLGFKCWNIRFVHGIPESVHNLEAPAVDGQALYQTAGSVITYYVFVPDEATLRASGVLLNYGDPWPDKVDGVVRVMVTDADGVQEECVSLTSAELTDSPEFSVDYDLGDHAGRPVAISFSYSVTGRMGAADLELPEVEWEAPRVVGTRARLVASDLGDLPKKYNILIVNLDALRSDYLEPYGATHVRTPYLAKLAQDGVTFVNGRANCSWALTSVASLFTGLFPATHGKLEKQDKISEQVPFLAEILKREGYATCAILNNAIITSKFGFGRGYDEEHHFYKERDEVRRRLITPRAQAGHVWETYVDPVVRRHEKNPRTPFFIYLHETDPHAPYEPPAPYDTLYDVQYRGGVGSDKASVFMQKNQFERLEKADIAYLESQYKGEITFMDEYVGDLLRRFDERGLLDNTLVVLLSAHGEEFLEHGRVGHNFTLHEEVLRVPLMFYLKDRLPAGRRPRIAAQLVDVTPTILDLVGIDSPAGLDGESLAPSMFGPEDYAPDRLSIAKLHRGYVDSLQRGDWKLIRRPRITKSQKELDFALYNLATDPSEQFDQWPNEHIRGRALARQLYRHLFQTQSEEGAPREFAIEETDE